LPDALHKKLVAELKFEDTDRVVRLAWNSTNAVCDWHIGKLGKKLHPDLSECKRIIRRIGNLASELSLLLDSTPLQFVVESDEVPSEALMHERRGIIGDHLRRLAMNAACWAADENLMMARRRMRRPSCGRASSVPGKLMGKG